MPAQIPRELRAAIALENARAEVAEQQTPRHDPFGWMKGPNFNPVTGEYWDGPIGRTQDGDSSGEVDTKGEQGNG
jgi:hypothetical protein